MRLAVDGKWSDDYAHEMTTKEAKLVSQARPRLYYAIVLDCDQQLIKTFSTGQFPRLTHEIHFTT